MQMGEFFPHKRLGRNGLLYSFPNAIVFGKFVENSDNDPVVAEIVVDILIEQPKFLTNGIPGVTAKNLEKNVGIVRDMHLAMRGEPGFASLVDGFFTSITRLNYGNVNNHHSQAMQRYGKQQAADCYNHLCDTFVEVSHSFSARAAILHACVDIYPFDGWVIKFQGAGHDLVYMHSSDANTAIEQKRPQTHTLAHTPAGTLWARQGDFVPEPIATLDWPFEGKSPVKGQYIRVLHYLARRASSKHAIAPSLFPDAPNLVARTAAALRRYDLQPIFIKELDAHKGTAEMYTFKRPSRFPVITGGKPPSA